MKSSLFTNFFVFFLIFLPILTLGAEFDPGYLISDSEILNYKSMTQPEIQNFLAKRNGALAGYITFDRESNLKSASQAFYEIALNRLVSPKYLMVLVQKEQSLLENPAPSQRQYDWATGYSVCDGCSTDDPKIQRWKGFYKQVDSAAAQTRWDVMGKDKNTGVECIPTAENSATCIPNNYLYQPGKTYTISGQKVTIENSATGALYKYTPHVGDGSRVGGNKLFWDLWNKYFNKKWPNGSLLQAEYNDKIYYIENDLKREIASKAVFASRFNSKNIITVSQADIDSYESGVPIKYLNFSLLKGSSSGNVYMVVNDMKRKIADDEVLRKLGFNSDSITTVNEIELILYKDGADITQYTHYPTGALFQDSKAVKPYEKLYYIISGEKKPVLTKEIFDANFSGMKIEKASSAILDGYLPGTNVTLPDGWLIKTPTVNTVYVISNGKIMPIYNAGVFKSMKYDFANVKVVSDETLKAHQLSQTITGSW
jgi:hypothetical protein